MMKKREVIGTCPICQHHLHIEQLGCEQCGTKISGQFIPNKFSALSKAHLQFIEIFIKNRGNIKEIEKEMGISYPTVRNKLDEVIVALGYHISGEQTQIVNKGEVLRQLELGEITQQEALNMLKK